MLDSLGINSFSNWFDAIVYVICLLPAPFVAIVITLITCLIALAVKRIFF